MNARPKSKRSDKKLEEIRAKKIAAADESYRRQWGDRRPVYGDPEQILILKRWRRAVTEAETDFVEALNSPGLRAYRVSFDSVTVYAMSADEAEEFAEEEARVSCVEDEGPAPDGVEEGVEF